MNLLSFSYCFPHAAAPTWGVFVQQRLAAMARRADLQVVSPVPTFPLLARLRGTPGPVEGAWDGMTVHRPRFFYFPGVLKSLDARLYAAGVHRRLARVVDEFKPDILDAHFIWPDGVAVGRLAKKLGISYTITLRGKLYPCLNSPSQKRQCAEALRNAAAVISVDRRMADVARELGAADDRLHVIPNGVDLAHFQLGDQAAARSELQLPADARLLVSVAHLGERKGHCETVRALSRLPEDVQLILVGGDSAAHSGGKQQLIELADSLGVRERVLFVGKQPYELIPRYFQAANASVLASWREGCPNVVLESLACGTPVVATDVGAVPMMIEDGRNGRIVPVRDPERLAEAIRTVLDSDMSPEQMRSSPSVRSWDDIAGDVLDVFEQAVR